MCTGVSWSTQNLFCWIVRSVAGESFAYQSTAATESSGNRIQTLAMHQNVNDVEATNWKKIKLRSGSLENSIMIE